MTITEPALRSTIVDGLSGHDTDHDALHALHNLYFSTVDFKRALPLQHMQEALALADTTPFVLCAIGDSITEGVGLELEQTWLYLLGQSVAESVNLSSPGAGYCCANALAGGKWTSVTNTGTTLGANGLGARSWDSRASATNDRSLTVNCDRIKLFYAEGPNYGAFTVKIDGVLVDTVDSYRAAGLRGQVWDSGALTLGSHTIRIDSINTGSAKPVATFAVSIAGAFAYWGNYSSGVQTWNGGHSLGPSYVPSTVELDHLALIDPDLMLLTYGANDFALAIDEAQTHTNFVDAATDIASAVSHDVSFAFLATWGKIGEDASWPVYVEEIRSAAVEYGAAHLDMRAALGQQTPSTVLSDGVGHPNVQASYVWRDVIVGQLPLPRARGAVQRAGDYLTGVLNWRVVGELYHRLRIGAGLGGIPFLGFGDGATSTDLGTIQYDAANDALNVNDMFATFNKVSKWIAAGDTTWRVRVGAGVGGIPFVGFNDGSSGADLATLQYDIVNDKVIVGGATFEVGALNLTGTLLGTAGTVKLGDGTAVHGDVRIFTSAFGTSINLYGDTGDADANPKLQLTGSGVNLGAGGIATDCSIARTGVAAIGVTGALTGNSSIKSSSASAGVGYATGAGGAVTQATSKATGVTLNKTSGQITLNGAALAASTSVSFTLTNSAIAATDTVIVAIATAATAGSYVVTVDAVAAGSCRIHVRNTSAGSLSEALVLNFAVLKAVAA
jgi:lysophospholipase L1-like esterase